VTVGVQTEVCAVTVAVQTETAELSGHAACQVTFRPSGPKLKSNSSIYTDSSSTKQQMLLRDRQQTVICLKEQLKWLMYFCDTKCKNGINDTKDNKN
jgi:hypothetical protein